jgi:aspartate kinase
MTGKLRVEKIGGTSMTRFAECAENIILRNKEDIYNRVYVVSAYGGVTNALLEHKKTGAPGIYKKFEDQEDYKTGLLALREKLCQMNETYVETGLDLKVANEFFRVCPSEPSSARGKGDSGLNRRNSQRLQLGEYTDQ